MKANVLERFASAANPADHISCMPTTYGFRLPGPPSELLDSFRHYYGPTMSAFATAEANGNADDLHAELAALFTAQNQGGDGNTVIPATYLKVVFQKP